MMSTLSDRIEEAMARLGGADPDGAKSTLLVVDDERGPRESLRMILSPQHRVLMAEDGPGALEVLRREHVDAVTVDLNMPGMKGDALMRTIRSEFPKVEVIIITGYSSVETAVDGLRHGVFDYLTKPFDVVEVSAVVRRALARRSSRARLVGFLNAIGEVLGHEREPGRAIEALTESPTLRSQMRAVLAGAGPSADDANAPEIHTGELLETLAETIESRDPHRVGHARRVSFLSCLIAERMGLHSAVREEIRVSAFLHDIGRIGVQRSEPIGAGEGVVDGRSPAAHAVIGAQLVEPLGFPPSVPRAILHHHERFDGRGYPDGLVGDNIPLVSRILAIADAFDALTHDDPCRGAVSEAEAIDTLRDRAGSEFDPDLLKELIALAETGASSAGPMIGLTFEPGDDPVQSIAAATAWIEDNR
jgi:putative nucleotidyltransferase with HDIG domain